MLTKKHLALLSVGASLSFWDIFNVPYIENYASATIGQLSSTLILTSEMLGYVVGGIINGAISTRFGRKNGLITSMLFIFLGSLLGFLSSSVPELLMSEFVIGMGIEGEIAVVPAYVSEMTRPEFRGRAVGITSLGGFLMSLVVGPVAVYLGEDQWKLLFVPSILISALALVTRLWFPESKMWIKKRNETLKFDKSVVVFLVVWFASYFTGYALFATPVFNLISQNVSEMRPDVAFTYMLYGDPLGVVVGSVLNDLIERRTTTVMTNGLTSVLMVLWPFMHSYAFIAIGFTIMFLQGMKFPAMYAYTAENIGTKLRSLGQGIADGIGHLGGAVGPIVYVFMDGLTNVSIATQLVGLVSLIAGGFALAYGLKTNNRSLEELKG